MNSWHGDPALKRKYIFKLRNVPVCGLSTGAYRIRVWFFIMEQRSNQRLHSSQFVLAPPSFKCVESCRPARRAARVGEKYF